MEVYRGWGRVSGYSNEKELSGTRHFFAQHLQSFVFRLKDWSNPNQCSILGDICACLFLAQALLPAALIPQSEEKADLGELSGKSSR